MTESFCDDYYVHRPADEQEIASCVGTARILALHGERGSGKTTLLRRIAFHGDKINHPAMTDLTSPTATRMLNRDVSTSMVHFVNLSDVDSLDSPRLTVDSLLAFIASRLSRRIFGRSPDGATQRSWDGFRISRADSFEQFADEARRAYDAVTPNDLSEACQNPDSRAMFLDCDDRFRAAGQERLRTLLDFLAEEFNHRVVLLVDSLDQALPRVQATVALALARIVDASRSGASVVFAIRTENVPDLEQRLDRVGGMDQLGIEVSGLKDDSTELIRQFLLSRLQAVVDTAPLLLQTRDAREVNEADLRQLVDEMTLLVNVFTERALAERDRSPILDHLNSWHNGSLRLIGQTIARMLYDLLTDSNEVASSQYALELLDAEDAVPSEQYRILARTHLFRKFFFWGADEERSHFAACLPLRHLRRHPAASRILFPKLRLLDLLSREDCITLGDLRTVFRRFDVPDQITDRTARDLSSPRAPRDLGVVALNCDSVHDGLSDEEARSIELTITRAGHYMRDRYCHTTEYVFWCAATNRRASPCFAAAKQFFYEAGLSEAPVDSGAPFVSFDLLAQHSFRALVAAEYLDTLILPRYMLELPLPSGEDADGDELALVHAGEMFETFGDSQFPERLAGSIGGFVGDLRVQGLAEPVVASRVGDLVSTTNSYCEQLSAAAQV